MGNQKETQKNPQYKYASTREKLCFGIGAIGKDAICNLVGAFLMLYCIWHRHLSAYCFLWQEYGMRSMTR